MKRPPFWLAISAIALAVIAAALTALVMVPIWLHPQLPNTEISKVTDVEKRIALQQAQSQLQNETRATLLQSFAGLVLVAGALTTWRQVNINRHGQITERITRAVDQLAGDRMDVRVGGIFALERVALNSAEDRHIVTAIIATFVRTQAPWTTPPPKRPPAPTRPHRRRPAMGRDPRRRRPKRPLRHRQTPTPDPELATVPVLQRPEPRTNG